MLWDLEFGLVVDGADAPAPISGTDTIGEALQIMLLLNPEDFGWLPDFGANQSHLVFENMDPWLLASRARDRIVFFVSQFLPFVQIVEVVPAQEEFEQDETIVLTVRYMYQGDLGDFDLPLGV
jgi:phage baseplate assembly protein W